MPKEQGSYIQIQNTHILLWLLKDACWVMGFKLFGIFMIIPTLLVAVYLTIKSKNDKVSFYHNLGICSWIIGNSTWMLGDFYFKDAWRNQASFFFILGIAIILFYYLTQYLKKKD